MPDANPSKVQPIDVPAGSLLAAFGKAEDYRDCFARTVEGAVSLDAFIERFYCSMAFQPERLALSLIGRGASNDDARAVASGKAETFAAWDVMERRENEILLRDFQGATASWLSVQISADPASTRLMFGSWVGGPESRAVKALMGFHVLYSKVLLRGV